MGRIIFAPFIYGILFITHNWFAIKRTIQFIRYGGEVNLYDKDDKKTIQDLYELLKEK